MRVTSALTSIVLVAATCATPINFAGDATPGVKEYQAVGLLELFGGSVNAIGGNLSLRELVLDVDNNAMIHFPIFATFNSSSAGNPGQWILSFQMRFEGDLFIDETGARHITGNHAHGQPINGTHWDYWQHAGNAGVRSKSGLVHRFDSSGVLQSIQGPGENRLQFEQNERPGQIGTIYECGAAWVCSELYVITYDAAGNPDSVSDAHGRTANLSWTDGNLESLTSAASHSWSYEYDGSLVSARVTPEQQRTEYEFDGQQLVTLRQVSAEFGNPENTFFYTGAGSGRYATEWTDPLGHKKRFVYTGEGRLEHIENVDTGKVLFAWSWAMNRPTSHTDQALLTTRMTWQNDSLVGITTPSGNVIGREYAASGLASSYLDLDGRALGVEGPRALLRAWDSLCPGGSCLGENTFDTLGRLVSSTNALGERVSIAYHWDSLQIDSITEPSGARSSLRMYVAGHPTVHTSSAYPGFAMPEKTISALGDTEVGASFYLPGLGGTKSRGFTADRFVRSVNLEETSDPTADCHVTIDSRSDGQPTFIDRPCGGDHEMRYDSLGRLAGRRERVDGAWMPWWTFEYDANGRRIQQTDPDGRIRGSAFDSDGNLEAFYTRPYDGYFLWDAVEQLSYEDGRVVAYGDFAAMISGIPMETYTYYAQGELGAGQMKTIEFADGTATEFFYDLRGRLTLKRFLRADGSTLRQLGFVYDLENRVVEELDGASLLVRHTFANGMLEATETGDGLTRTLLFDETGAYAGAETRDAEGSLVEETTYSILEDPSDTLAVETSTTTYWQGTPRTTAEESTIVRGRLQTNVLTSELGLRTRSFDFDFLGNLISDGQTTFAFNPERNRLLSAAAQGETAMLFAYDDTGHATMRDGKPITWTSGGCMASHGADTFEWTASCARLLSKTVDGVHTAYTYAGEIEELDGEPRIYNRSYVIDLTTSQRLYLHPDNRGNVRFVTDGAGTVVTHYGYGPFGLEVIYGDDGGAVTFVGQSRIGDLMVLGARIYDPGTGRFLSQDPVFDLANQYAYTNGNPIMFSDRGGREFSPSEAILEAGEISMVAGSAVLAVVTVVGTGGILLPLGVTLVVVGALYYVEGKIMIAIEDGGTSLSNSNSSPEGVGGGKEGCTCRNPPPAKTGEGGKEGGSTPGLNFPGFRFDFDFDFKFNLNLDFSSNAVDDENGGWAAFQAAGRADHGQRLVG